MGALAGITFFDTDFPLELAQKGFAIPCNNKKSQSFDAFACNYPETLSKDNKLLLAVAIDKMEIASVDPSLPQH